MFMEPIIPTVLICQQRQDVTIVNAGQASITTNLSACLNEARSGNFSLVIVSLPVNNLRIRYGGIELCHHLKVHPLTQNTPVLVSVDSPHRAVAARLADSGVRFMEVRRPGTPMDPEASLRLVSLEDPLVSIDRLMIGLCPFIDYKPIDARCELVTCRAYKNRMVLGGRRLHEVCETDSHAYCECFLNPRVQ